MKPSRLRTLLIGIAIGVAYAFVVMFLIAQLHELVSVTYIFVLPLVLGAIPVLFSTKEQLETYLSYLIYPWIITLSFFLFLLALGSEGMICLVIIIGPFIVIGSLGAFVARFATLNLKEKTPLYASLLLPLLAIGLESMNPATNQFHTVQTTIEVQVPHKLVWNNTKNVRNIERTEITPHFVHLIGVPRPLDGQLTRESVGGIRQIVWEKGIRFQEIITSWNDGHGFAYDIEVDPKSIPPSTLDGHVMIGGRYFDILKGSYQIDSLAPNKTRIKLTCSYRITTNLNGYAKFWADFILNDFNETILEIIKARSERQALITSSPES